jgi:hypothetical protein
MKREGCPITGRIADCRVTRHAPLTIRISDRRLTAAQTREGEVPPEPWNSAASELLQATTILRTATCLQSQRCQLPSTFRMIRRAGSMHALRTGAKCTCGAAGSATILSTIATLAQLRSAARQSRLGSCHSTVITSCGHDRPCSQMFMPRQF